MYLWIIICSVVSGSQPLEDLSTPGQGQGEGPGDSESERSEDDDGVGRGRSERSERSSYRGWTPRDAPSAALTMRRITDREHGDVPCRRPEGRLACGALRITTWVRG